MCSIFEENLAVKGTACTPNLQQEQGPPHCLEGSVRYGVVLVKPHRPLAGSKVCKFSACYLGQPEAE